MNGKTGDPVTRRPKGAGSIRERDGRYQATYSYKDARGERKRGSERFDTKTEARAWLRDRTAEAAAGKVADRELTVGDYLTDWILSLELTGLEAATVSWYRSAVVRHIIPELGRVKLGKLTAVEIDAFLSDKSKNGRLDGKGPLAPKSVKRLKVTLGKALDAAVRKRLILTNPVDLTEPLRLPVRDVTVRVWNPDQLAEFIEAAGSDRLAGVWRLAAMSGLRRSELVGLQWGDIDLDAARLSVRRAVVIVDGGPPTVKSPKTAGSRRTVDLDEGTVTGLRDWRKVQLEERLIAGPAWGSGDWLVTDEIGGCLRPDYVGDLFRRIADRAGLPALTIRELRHSHATALLAAGVPPKVVQERLGHSSIAITMNVYSAVLPGMQRDAVEKLAAIIGR